MSFGGNFSAMAALSSVVDAAVVLGGPVDKTFGKDVMTNLLFLLSRETYEKFAATWSQVKRDPYFDRVINSSGNIERSADLAACHCHRSYISDDEDGSEILGILNEGGTDLIRATKINRRPSPALAKGVRLQVRSFWGSFSQFGCSRDATLTGGEKTALRRFSSINVAGDNEDDCCAD